MLHLDRPFQSVVYYTNSSNTAASGCFLICFLLLLAGFSAPLHTGPRGLSPLTQAACPGSALWSLVFWGHPTALWGLLSAVLSAAAAATVAAATAAVLSEFR